jgi:hypothetical protein
MHGSGVPIASKLDHPHRTRSFVSRLELHESPKREQGITSFDSCPRKRLEESAPTRARQSRAEAAFRNLHRFFCASVRDRELCPRRFRVHPRAFVVTFTECFVQKSERGHGGERRKSKQAPQRRM